MNKTAANVSRQRGLIAAALLAVLAAAGTDTFAQTGAVAAQQVKIEQEQGAHSDAALAAAALNPIAAMISVPLQYNYDQDIGRLEEGRKNYLNVQPVIPASISHDWNLITRIIVPLVSQNEVVPTTGGQSGIGDTTMSLFFSPKALTESGWTWGVGPVFYLPTATDDYLGASKWGAGPTAVLLKQEHGWTYGALVNHIWSVGGSGKRDISNTFLQPFVSYTNKSLFTVTLQTETQYNWETSQWTVPIHLLGSQFFKIGEQKMTFQVGARYWATGPDGGPHGWGLRSTLTFLFPAAH
jgi:hypothetical protein